MDVQRRNAGLLAPALVMLGLATAGAQETLEPVVVTATRTAETVDETLASVSVLTREEIERSPAEHLPELLGRVRGVDRSTQGGLGKVSSLFLRGTNSDHVLVLVDGMRLQSATTGQTALQHLPLSQIERIEVVRGPRSTLYGADAVGGVIQIFTRQSGGHVRLGGGSYDTYEASAGYGRQGEEGGFSINASGLTSGGFDAREPTTGPFGVDEPDDDGYDNLGVSLRGHRQLSQRLEVSGHLLRTQGNNEFDGVPNEADFVQQSLGVDLSLQASERWDSKLSLGQSLDDTENMTDGEDFSSFKTTQDIARWQNDLYLGAAHLLTLGLEYRNTQVDASTDFKENERDNKAAFIQHQWMGRRADLQWSLRLDDNEAFGEHTTGSIAWGYPVADGMRLTASFGTAFKAPTFNDLYFPDVGFFEGNPDLDPEESRTYELGLRGQGPVRWQLEAYRTEIDDLITFDGGAGTVRNIDSATIHGLEAGVSAGVGPWQGSLDVTLLDARDDETDNRLPRRAEETLNLTLRRTLGRWELGGSFIAQGGRFDDAANEVRLGGYGRLDLHARYQLAEHWHVKARLDNVFDKDYQTAATFNTVGRSAFAYLVYQGE